MSQQKPFAFFQRHPLSRIWQEVVVSAAGQPGVVAAYLEGATVLAGEDQPDDLQWIAEQHVSIKVFHTHQFGEEQGTLHPDAISDALRKGLARGRAAGPVVSPPILQADFSGEALSKDAQRVAPTDADFAPVVEAEPSADVAIDDIHAALLAAGLMLVRTEHGLVIEKSLDAVAEQAAPSEDQSEDESEGQPAHLPIPVLQPISRVEPVGWSYTEEGGKKYLVRDRREGEKVAHMVEGVLYEGKPIEGVPETIWRLGQWLHAAYGRPPQTPQVIAMLESVDALVAVRQHVFMPTGAEPAAEVSSLTNQCGTMKGALLIDKSLPDGTLLYVGKEAPASQE